MQFEVVRYFESCGRDIHTEWAYGMETGRVSQSNVNVGQNSEGQHMRERCSGSQSVHQ
jgi:hypothetical protein